MEKQNPAIVRIQEMERRFDALRAAAEQSRPVDREELRLLTDYYESGQWLRDYELDEAGALPPELKRGVLSQDGVYDLLTRLADSE